MKILNRFRIFGAKEFWIGYWGGIKRGLRINKRMIEVNKMNVPIVVLDIILMPVMFPVSMLMIVFAPESIKKMGETFNDMGRELDL